MFLTLKRQKSKQSFSMYIWVFDAESKNKSTLYEKFAKVYADRGEGNLRKLGIIPNVMIIQTGLHQSNSSAF